MTALVVRPVHFTNHLPRLQQFLELIGLRPWIVAKGGGWSDMSCGGGRVALHDAATSDTGAQAGQTTLSFEAADVSVLAQRLTAAGLAEVTVYDEAYGRVLTCLDPEGARLAVDERTDDLYGYQLRAEPGTEPSLRVTPVRFTNPAGPYGGFLGALGLRAAGELNSYYVNFLAGEGRQGQVGLHHVLDGDQPVVAGTGYAAVQLNFETGEPLDRVAARLATAGFEPTIATEEFGSLLSVTDPDGQQVQVHAAAPLAP
jgi:predicted enzyme related to lactoylglutathione lyase